ncbi:SCO0930 family lipoprotein [Amycolatopsis sp. ATCC 39116]|uniref:SCO0930 family lipoprotein n=1 Tax=Amycolatopsis sp. (strain ATCC 39116 / 75iv2) TaxID=385957 RepID=UPI00026260F2|nr:SCO0930 family lipoprotein [Amycolatopsis sp. ATCC 39116]
MTARIVLPAAALAGLALLTACGQGEPGPAAGPVAIQQAAAVQPAVGLVASDVDGLGPVLTDSNGLTLYRFDRDTARPPKSACAGDCATTWPPVIATGAVDVRGVDAKLVGTVARADGTQQVTVNGWPVYRYAKDTVAGEAKGQGVGGTWAAITPTGAKAATPETAIRTTNIPGLDTVLTDGDGRTIYLFTKDGKNPPKTTCEGQCATTWPPVVARGETRIEGVAPELVGTVTRPDGTEQVTVGGWPVYTYAQDTAPGQANGHTVGGTWFAIETNGCKVAAEKKPLAAAPSSY